MRYLLFLWLIVGLLLMGGSPEIGFQDQMVGLDNSLGGREASTDVWESKTAVFCPDSSITHGLASFNTAVANADFVYEIGTGQDIEDFAYGIVDSSDVDREAGIYSPRNWQMDYPGGGDWDVNKARALWLTYLPFEDSHPL